MCAQIGGVRLKKIIPIALFFLLGVLVCAVVLFTILGIRSSDSFQAARTAARQQQAASNYTAEAEESRNAELLRLSEEVVQCIRAQDYVGLSQYVHPEYGVTFSPYSNVDFSVCQQFTAAQVAAFGSDSTVYRWGSVAGSNDVISMTPAAYFARFVFDVDFSQAPIAGFNYIVRSGNTLENVKDVFADAQFVDLYYPGTQPEQADWRILRLVFEDSGGAWKLSAVIHNEATV